MAPESEETVDAHFARLLREAREREALILASSARAIEESYALLDRVARDHPEICDEGADD